MRLLIVLIITAAGVFVSLHPSAAAQRSPEVQEIIDRVDRLYRSDTSYGEIEMTIITPDWRRRLRMKIWTEGMDKTFLYITSPKKDAGIATLRIGSEMWNYFPKINKVMKVPPSMMMGSWMGSDFTNDDLVKESSLLRDYSARLINPEGADKDHYHIELIPKRDTPSVWGRIIVTVRKDDYIPVRLVYFDEKGRKMRVMEYKDIRLFGDRKLPAVLEMTPLNKEGHKTIIRYIDVRFNIKPDRETFTLRNLQRKRR
ncbi:MAG: outer membrane lipoprotein-sorting protein [Nitrospirota bacterium]|nr:outer membrane lipoprotein-sorting protein [Nitrospirota bacterium]